MEIYSETENGGVITKETEKYVTNKTNFNKLFVEGKIIDPKLIKYLPTPKKKMNLKKYINAVLFDKFD